jgi:hypothetical protein
VCEHCHLGLILTARADVAPAENEPFLVLDELMRIRAVSKRAERLLRITETEAVNRHVGDYLVPVEGGGESLAALAATVARVSRFDTAPQRVVLRPRGTFGVRYGVRVGRCSPEPAALLALAERL